MKTLQNEQNLLKLCSSSNMNIIKENFDHLSKTQIESIKDSQSASCLHYAARTGSIQILEYFIIQKNISAFLVSKVGATILHDAAVKGQIKTIEWILKNTDLNISVKDTDGATIIHLASKFDQLELIEWILDTYGNLYFKEQTYNGATCLHFACATNSFKTIVRLTTAVPSLVNMQMMNGVTPFYLVVQEDNFPAAKYLSKAGSNVHIKANDSMTPLHVACQNGSLIIAQYLCEEYMENVNEYDFNGSTPLHFACVKNSVKLVAYLLVNNAKILVDKSGNSPLHDCALNGHIECARLLISKNSDVSLKNKEGQNCIEIAQTNGHLKFVNEFENFLLKSRRALIDIRNTQSIPINISKNDILSPLNALNSLKTVPTSTPQDFITIISESTLQPKTNEINKDSKEVENNDKTIFHSRQLSRNQSLVKIVSKNDENTPQTRNSQNSNRYLKRSESHSQVSDTLTELNNCIAQFEKFSYFTEETFKNEKDIKFNEISDKLNEIKNTLIETKNKQINKTQEVLQSENTSLTSFTEKDSILSSEGSNTPVSLPIDPVNEFTQSNCNTTEMKSEIECAPETVPLDRLTILDKLNSNTTTSTLPNSLTGNQGFNVPPPPPPPISGLFSKSNDKLCLKKIPKTENRNSTTTLRSTGSQSTLHSSSSSSNFIMELQSKLPNPENIEKNLIHNDSNNNSLSDMNNMNLSNQGSEVSFLSSEYAENFKRISMLRSQEIEIMPEWKRKLIEKKRRSKIDLHEQAAKLY